MDDEFQKRLLATFRSEAEEHIGTITAGLIELEKQQSDATRAEIVEAVFREAHSLKGAARAVGLADVEGVCQSLEGLFAQVKRGTLALTPSHFDAAHRAVDGLILLIAADARVGLGPGEVAALIRALEQAGAGEPRRGPSEAPPDAAAGAASRGAVVAGAGERAAVPPRAAAEPAPAAGPPAAGADAALRRAAPQSIRLRLDKLDELLVRSEELVALKLIADRALQKVQDLSGLLRDWDKQWSALAPVLGEYRRRAETEARAGRRRRREDVPAARLLEFSETVGDRMHSLQVMVNELDRIAVQSAYSSRTLVEGLSDEVKKLLMLPFAMVLEAFPKLVRDLARDQGKQVDLAITGESIEIDRRILEEMRVVFTHLLRNAVDHGVEAPEVRVAQGKPARATIRIDVRGGEGNSVGIVVADDGAGIDVQALRQACLEQEGPVDACAEGLEGEQLLELASRSGVSTSPLITDISGRGLGLAIVREKVEALGGRVTMQTRAGEGTAFAIALPLRLASFRGVLVVAAGRQFVVPTAGVERVVRLAAGDALTVKNRPAVVVDDVALPLVALAQILELEAGTEEAATQTVLILAGSEGRVGCAVDEIVGEQEVSIKALRPPLVRVPNVSGVTILGSGAVIPVLDVADLAKSAGRRKQAASTPPHPDETARPVRRSVLVADDSITSRMLLKSILETAGYAVLTAVDGVDALSQLRMAEIDAVVSDVDMPRMDGFTLTERIRADARLAELPMVLVTSLSSAEDRERGVDAGANAYIVKSSFDQSNLLEALARLL